MEKNKLIKCLRILNLENAKGISYTSFLDTRLKEVYEKLQTTHEYILGSISDITKLNFSRNVNLEWNYICLGFYILKLLSRESESSGDIFLSVQETKDLKIFIQNLVIVGICTKLQPNLPFKMKSEYFVSEDIYWDYNVLKCTTFGLTEYLKVPFLRFVILPENLKEILVALYQISYCLLKKPDGDEINQEIYEKLLLEQQLFKNILDYLKQTIHPHIFVKENMLCLHKNSPLWFKKQISQDLTNILRSKDGIETVVTSLFGDCDNNTQNWKILEVFSKLIISCEKFPDFEENICKQLIGLLHKQSINKSFMETIFAYCTKTFYKKNPELCKKVFVKNIIANFLHFTYKSHKFSQEDVTEKVEFTSRMLHALFIDNNTEELILPANLLQPIINVAFKFYILTLNSIFKTVNNDLRDLLLFFIEVQLDNNIFDIFLFDLQSNEISPIRNDILIEVEINKIKIKSYEQSIKYSSIDNCEGMYKLLKSKPKLLIKYFWYLLNCITNEKKYFQQSSQDLLVLEESITNINIERKIVVYKLLAELAAEKCIRKELNENPIGIVKYIKRTLEVRSESMFTILMILDNLLSNSSKDNKKYFKELLEPLKLIRDESEDFETKYLVKNILECLEGNKIEKPEDGSELDKAIDDICDCLLPTRGHGLLTLTKLIEKKDKEVLERKQFVLNILQQNITDKDSFIYLNAINGLAAMADIFPNKILNLLCEEYLDTTRKDNVDYSEVRMKLGEVLVKVTKVLGEMAPQYKPLLLNTFLIGSKDDDDLIRSSSLSNLGEICRVLGYKLGSIFTEVLVCVHAIIATDKSPQARRAAVTVIRQLFVGLDQDIIVFFKEDILPVYKTLKQIYNNDKDDVMRLQAQLALEELNESMKNFVFPTPKLNINKNIVMLK
ncbi:transport and Golgi organization protein 6 homolog [Diorhabda sublineata]|uniref:transport and Golgi organization protein 6 homolog n=1 Tax=Diorhabda sublineata TaxID=1163346 RepID=UPI0024E138AB|nr:transport and Golgi organization protein 6 homolog [Diorhabda sublineata]